MFPKLCFFLLLLLFSCRQFAPKENENFWKLKIIHAGSLTVPIKIICDSFKKHFPQVQIYTEACGSKQCARSITELNKEFDIFISADYKIIDQMLIPHHATWNILFAGNEMAIVFNEKSKYSNEINANNWFDILFKKDVAIGRSDPNSDPCGVRAILTIKLSEKYYNLKGLSNKLLSKDLSNIRPKETDLLALLETNTIDYVFLYKSVAVQHNLNFISLPDEINLRNPMLNNFYNTASVVVNGSKPGEKKIERGEAIIYGITILSNSHNQKLAEAFIYYSLTKGLEIFRANGQQTFVPLKTSTFKDIPIRLQKIAKLKQ